MTQTVSLAWLNIAYEADVPAPGSQTKVGTIHSNGRGTVHGLNSDVVKREMAEAGFQLLPSYDFTKAGGQDHFLVFAVRLCWLCDGLSLKRENVPELATFFEARRINSLAGKHRDGMLPKMEHRMIRLHHANLPPPRELSPHFMRYFGANPTSPISANNKEFRHIPDRLIA